MCRTRDHFQGKLAFPGVCLSRLTFGVTGGGSCPCLVLRPQGQRPGKLIARGVSPQSRFGCSPVVPSEIKFVRFLRLFPVSSLYKPASPEALPHSWDRTQRGAQSLAKCSLSDGSPGVRCPTSGCTWRPTDRASDPAQKGLGTRVSCWEGGSLRAGGPRFGAEFVSQ